jgi:hypothetical protein
MDSRAHPAILHDLAAVLERSVARVGFLLEVARGEISIAFLSHGLGSVEVSWPFD